MKEFEEAGLELNVKQTVGPLTSWTEENVKKVCVSVRRKPDLSTHKSSAQLRISCRSLRTLKLVLKLYPHKIQVMKELKPNELILRKAHVEY